MGLIELIAATAGLLLLINRIALYLWPEATRTFFSKHVLRRSQGFFNIVALILLGAAAYVLYTLIQSASFGAIITSIVAGALLVGAWFAYNSDIWKHYAQIFLKKPTGWLRIQASIDALIGLLILLLTIGSI